MKAHNYIHYQVCSQNFKRGGGGLTLCQVRATCCRLFEPKRGVQKGGHWQCRNPLGMLLIRHTYNVGIIHCWHYNSI